MTGPPQTPAALDGVRVLDFSDDLAAYAGRLLADLGAEVIWVSCGETRRAVDVPPHVTLRGESRRSTFELFVNAGKQVVEIEPDSIGGRARLRELVELSDIIIESSRPRLESLLGEGAHNVLEEKVRVVVTPFGLGEARPWQGFEDLLVMAESGLLHLGGYVDSGPIAAAGGQSRFGAGIFGAVAALCGLLRKEAGGGGSFFDVSAQECIAQALEDSATTFALTDVVRGPTGDVPREAASGIYACKDGFVSMIAGRLGTARAWTSLVEWITTTGSEVSADLLHPRWQEFAYRRTPEAVKIFGRIFAEFAADKTKEELYHEAQRRRIALSPIATVSELLHNEQLAHRDFFREKVVDGTPLTFPGSPYRMSRTPPVTGTPQVSAWERPAS